MAAQSARTAVSRTPGLCFKSETAFKETFSISLYNGLSLFHSVKQIKTFLVLQRCPLQPVGIRLQFSGKARSRDVYLLGT